MVLLKNSVSGAAASACRPALPVWRKVSTTRLLFLRLSSCAAVICSGSTVTSKLVWNDTDSPSIGRDCTLVPRGTSIERPLVPSAKPNLIMVIGATGRR
ncbi:hypothetical protein D3C87_1895180 [compost metagenome]